MYGRMQELTNKKQKIEQENKDLLQRGEKAESKAAGISLFINLLVGPALIVLKVIKYGWHYFPAKHGWIMFLLESAGIFVLSWIALYILVKPFETIYRKKYKKNISKEEYAQYKKLSMELFRIKSEMEKLEKEDRKLLGGYSSNGGSYEDMTGDEHFSDPDGSDIDVSDM